MAVKPRMMKESRATVTRISTRVKAGDVRRDA
jgi:hypothetical protein